MRKTVKSIISLIVIVLIFSFISTEYASAESTINVIGVSGTNTSESDSVVNFTNIAELESEFVDKNGMVDTMKLNEIRVFIAGILVGYVINGYFIALVGGTPDQLIAKIINYSKKNRIPAGCHIAATKKGHVYTACRGKF